MSIKPSLKNLAYLLLVLLISALFTSVKSPAFYDSVNGTAIKNTGVLQGTWKLLDGEFVDDKGQIKQYQDLKLTALKVLDDNHFSFISMADGKFWASAAGQYQVTGNQYQEHLRLASFKHEDGQRFVFTFHLAGDLWITERFDGNGRRVEFERWQRQ
ncbi:hypothetical protein FE810_14860 [Thalassotalea litorea]|uniref:DUF1579 domain-containing protein n=1 Tax=Thalassotalea litorea TaxID=2020715 RepID=A0A5R9IMS3_9GAMM|nr:hypothetical protein [Thalassotalea litorea]TLU61289.1 hypothetical protein FE810_14860 [Thalassotalea litorea]